jgi:cytoskeletal protein CcmA (bactofilin family)
MASFGKSIIFKGDLTGDEDLEIEGRVEGQVKLPNHQLTIGAHGRVTAQVEAKLVVVTGHVSGNVTASERVEVQASGIVDGDISAPRLLIQEGAVVNGSIQMGAAAAKSAVPAPAAPPAQSQGQGQGQDARKTA